MSNTSKVYVSPLDVTWHDVSGKHQMEVSETPDAFQKESQMNPRLNIEKNEPTSVNCSQGAKKIIKKNTGNNCKEERFTGGSR